MTYVDGFLLPVKVKNLKAYAAMSRKVAKVWREHGALDYKEYAGDDLHVKGTASFADQMKAKRGETVVFAYIVYKSRAHRDKVNAKVMKDPRLTNHMHGTPMPFDWNRMLYGGFRLIVDGK
jgi:uncharacterized protein YbaA (DUF1428 family)